MPTLDRITLYPVKSLDGVDVDSAGVFPSGSLEFDRRWRLVDLDGGVVDARRHPLFHAIRAEFVLAERLVSLSIDSAALAAQAIPGIDKLAALRPASFHLVPGPEGPCGWLSEALAEAVLLQERADGGFPADADAPGPTLVSTASLAEVARWFGFDLAESRRRFRANLEIGGCDAFWEDTLASPARPGLAASLADLPGDIAADPYAALPPPEPQEFAIGAARLQATNVVKRCAVASRDSRTGAVTDCFRDAFEARRGAGLRSDVDAGGWGHLYRLAVNTTGLLRGPGRLSRGAKLGA
ncbi:hypothetical protein EBR56_00980 [bacterium]|nr:hypothetical protein [bacterium]